MTTTATTEASAGGRPRCGVVGSDPALLDATVALLSAWIPGGEIVVQDAAGERTPPDAPLLVVTAGDDATALELARGVRLRGHAGALLLLLSGDGGDEARRLGATVVAAPWDRPPGASRGAEGAAEFGDALEAALRAAEERARSPEASVLAEMVVESRRLLAAGAHVAEIQHRMNNPLTALLAEAQLLELEELAPEARESVSRIVEQARRLTELTRALGT